MSPAPRKPSTQEVESLLDQAARDFEEHRFTHAQKAADQALQMAPDNAEAHHLRAASLLEQGEVDPALDAFNRALKLAPDDPHVLLDAADLMVCRPGDERALVERGVSLCTRGRKLARKMRDKDLEFEFLLLEATGLNKLGECEGALLLLDQALTHAPNSLEATLERGVALFELCRFEEAEKAFTTSLAKSPDDAWAHHYLGLLAERRGDSAKAKTYFERAQSLSPEDFPPPVHLDDDAFDRAVEDAMSQLPEHVKQYLDNATIAVEPIPSDEDLKSGSPPLSPTILGVFSGTPVGHRTLENAADHYPASIVLYQRNLERFARTREELIEQIGITVMHEVGHLIGLDEHELSERGLE